MYFDIQPDSFLMFRHILKWQWNIIYSMAQEQHLGYTRILHLLSPRRSVTTFDASYRNVELSKGGVA